MKKLKRIISLVMCLGLLLTFPVNANAYDVEISGEDITSTLIDTKVYNAPYMQQKFEQIATPKVLISGEDSKKMTDEQFTNFLANNTKLLPNEISEIVKTVREAQSSSISTNSLISPNAEPIFMAKWHEYTWTVAPYVSKTETWVNYTTSWIGIDAYRSSTGMTKGFTEEKQVSKTFSFTGSAEMKKFKPQFSYSYTETQKTSISESTQAPAWTTLNWRPYIAFYRDYYTGTYTDTTYGAEQSTGNVLVISVVHTTHSGIEDRHLVSTTELWSRENYARNQKAATPLPPSSAPVVN